MRERGDILVGLLVGLLLIFPLGYVVHVSPRFPGSLGGSLIGVLAALLMLATLPYVAAKHIGWVDRRLSRFVSKPTLLAIHIYAGVLAPLLGLVHAAHKFQSPLGLMLTGIMLLTVTSGFVGRYLLAQAAKALRGRRSELASLETAFHGLPASGAAIPEPQVLGRWARYFFVSGEAPDGSLPAEREDLAAAVADMEYAVRAEAATNALFAKWRTLHIVVGILLFILLLVHVGAAVVFGLRWL